MCIVLFQWQPDSDMPLQMAANRDEFHARPAEAARWRGDIFCGLDLRAGGTWLGIDRQGRMAVVTNYREPIADSRPGERSRGLLPMAFLQGQDSPEQFVTRLAEQQDHYGSFNLLVADRHSLWYLGNRGAPPQPVPAGIHGLSNGLLDDPWPKVQLGKQHLAKTLQGNPNLEDLLTVVNQRQQPADDELPDTGVGLLLERLVAPVFIQSENYGTRASSAVQLSRQGQIRMLERRWNPAGEAQGDQGSY